jgi:hypothetical protein
VGQGCKAGALAWQHQSSTGGLAIFKSLSRWRRFVSSLQSAEDFIKSALGVGPTKRRSKLHLGRYRRQFRLEALEPRVLLSYGTPADPLDSQAQLLAFLRRKVEDESLPSSFSDAQPLAPLAGGEAGLFETFSDETRKLVDLVGRYTP